MPLTLVIGHKNYSSWSLRPWILLKHLGEPFNELVLPLYGDEFRTEIAKYSPAGRVPVLVDGDFNIWDSLAIVEHLAERTGHGWPKDPVARAWGRSISAEMHSGFLVLRSQCPMYYQTEELWFEEWEHGGAQFEKPENYEKFNPVNHVDQWRTPMLVTHGQLDFRVPYGQGLSAFTALQRRGIESRLVIFPDENHWILKPHNSLEWHREVLTWLDKWLKNPDR